MSDLQTNKIIFNFAKNAFHQKGFNDTKSLFLYLDENKDGRLNFNEFEMGLKKIQKNIDNQSINRLFVIMDPQNTGLIDFATFAKTLEIPTNTKQNEFQFLTRFEKPKSPKHQTNKVN